MEERRLSYQRLAEVTDEKLTEAKSYAEELYVHCDRLTIDEIRVLAGQVFSIIDEWQTYYNRFNTIINKDKDNDIVEKILKENKVLSSALVEIIERYSRQVGYTKDLAESINKVLNLIDDNASALEFSVRAKKSKGVNSPSYIKELDTQELVSKYIKAGYKLTTEIASEYQEKFGITYNGLRNRLIQAGVWKANRQ